MDSKHGPSWIDTCSIFIAWKPRKNHSGSLSIPQKYITFAKESLARLVGDQVVKNLVEVKLFGYKQPPIISNIFVLDLILCKNIIL